MENSIAAFLTQNKYTENTAEEVLQKAYTSSQRAMMIQVPDTFHCHFSIVFTESKGMDEYYFHRTQSPDLSASIFIENKTADN